MACLKICEKCFNVLDKVIEKNGVSVFCCLNKCRFVYFAIGNEFYKIPFSFAADFYEWFVENRMLRLLAVSPAELPKQRERTEIL